MYSAPESEKIRNLFSSIAGTYDRANDVITFGMARGWRRQVVEWSGAAIGDTVLDCATGTGDLAFEFKKAVGFEGRVVGIDFCAEMLNEAPKKAQRLGLPVEFQVADALELPFRDQVFDVTSIAYGIRNVADPAKAISEMARVTKPGGVVMVLETGETQNPVLRSMIQLYFRHLVPRFGGWVSGNKAAYEYLNQSSSQFPCRENFVALLQKSAGFSSIEYKTLMGGASFIYRAVVA